ncbi:MAG: hypothetical protein NUV97_02800 [archaeon]|nr:hypothetical protein [archaeon]
MIKNIITFCFSTFCFIFFVSALTITGNPILTGEATSASTTVSIVVITPPVLSIVSPGNYTYLKPTLLVNYTVSNGDVNNYSINDSVNTSISEPINITFAEGVNTLNLWANNSDGVGQAHETVNFTVNTTLLVIAYSDYNGSKKGSSTDFYNYPFENLTNMSGIVLEHTDHGKISFSEAINVSNDSDNDDFAVNINDNVIILNNFISVDSTALPNFNKSALITMYNLTHSNPRILRDDVVCPSTICSGKSYNSDTGTLTFSVTQFSKYSVDETPTTSTPTPSTGGGGGGGGTIDRHLDIIIEGILEIGKGDQVVVPVRIYNTESISLKNIKLSATSISPYLHPAFEDTEIAELGSGKNETLMLFLSSDADSETGNYEIKINAAVGNPKFAEKASLYIQLVEILGGSEILERIKIAQDLFRENPRCLELNDLLIEAGKLSEQGKVKEAKTLVQEAIYRCRELVTSKEYPLVTNFGEIPNWRIIIEIILGLLVVTLIILAFLRKPKMNLYKARGKK